MSAHENARALRQASLVLQQPECLQALEFESVKAQLNLVLTVVQTFQAYHQPNEAAS